MPGKTGALIRAVNRELAKRRVRLCRARVWDSGDAGAFYVVDISEGARGEIVASDVDPAELARSLGVSCLSG